MTSSPVLQFELEGYYLLRRPLLPLQTVLQLHAATCHEPQLLLSALLDIFRTPLLQEAIYTASPDLHAELLKTLRADDPNASKSPERLRLTLYKYLLRMSARCTPYGLFAGCAPGELAGHTAIEFAPQPLRKHSRLDMNYVSELLQHLLAAPTLKEAVRYYPNNSLYPVADKYRYVEHRVANKHRSYQLTSVDRSSYLEALLAAAQEGGRTFAQLVALVQAFEPTITPPEAHEFLEQVIESQLLVSELEPTITGPVYLGTLPARLAGKVPPAQLALLQEILGLLATGGVVSFQQIHRLLHAEFGRLGSKDLIQTDLFYHTTRNQLSAHVGATIARQLGELWRLVQRPRLPDLTRFRQEFSERFEGQEVPLLLALDNELGVGYGSTGPGNGDFLPLLDGLHPPAEEVPSVAWTKLTQLTHAVYHRAIRTGAHVVELNEADLATLEAQPDAPAATPASLYALGTLLATSPQHLDAGEFQFALGACAGPSAANLLGRFCYGSEQLLKQVRATLQRAEPDTDDTVFAEIVHLPEARVGNILMRPVLRAYEIPLLSPAAVPASHQIPVQDLYVSVRQGQVVLRSRRLGKRVIPRLSTAHNYRDGLPLYRFLCELPLADAYGGLSWNWESLSQQPFLPRVQYKQLIVARARWQVKRADLSAPVGDAQLQAYLKAHQLPRYFCLAERDNELVIDQEHPAARQLLLQHLEKEGVVRLIEFLATPNQCLLQAAGQCYTNEVLLPLRNPGASTRVAPAAPPRDLPTRAFPPSSEWVYAKLYGGTKSTEALLTQVVLPLAAQWQARGLIRQWFFIRYADPQHHLRVRFHLAVGQLGQLASLLEELYAALAPAFAHGQLQKMQLDTYVRELERYGPANIENSEALFGHDSQATAGVLALLGGDEGESYRWPLALRGLDELLDDFGLTLPEKQHLMGRLSESFFQEFNGNKALTVQLNEKYRQERLRIQRFLDCTQDASQGIEEATALFARRRQQWQPVISAIRAQHPGGLLATAGGYSLLSSYVHMYVNRFVLSKPRLHELALYTLLYKYYTSQVAQGQAAAS